MLQMDLEKQALAILLHDFSKIDQVYIQAKWFKLDIHQAIVNRLLERHGHISGLMELYALTKPLVKRDEYTFAYLKSLEGLFVSESGLPYLLADLQKNELRLTLEQLKAEHSQFPTFEIEQAMEDILVTLNRIGIVRDDGKLDETFQLIEYQLENDIVPGIKTFSGLDMAIGGGIQPGMLITVGARPSVGKSAFAINLMDKALQRNEGMRIDFFSLEMPKREILARFIALRTGLNTYYLKNMNKMLSSDQKIKVRQAIEYYRGLDIQVFDRVSDLNRILAIIKERSAGCGQGKYLAVIDYVGLIKVENSKKDRRLQIEEITRELKILANEHQVPIVILSQLSRGVEQRQDKQPILSDLRESGSIEQDSNLVGFLYATDTEENREGYQNIEFQIRKNREGDLMNIKFKFYKAKMQFSEVFT